MREGTARGVVYQLTGNRHAAVLAVSVRSLIEHYSGPICILAGDDKAAFYADKIAYAVNREWDVFVDVRRFDAANHRHSGYANKTRLGELSPFDKTVFLDADTVVCGKIDDVWPVDNEIVVTQFADWVTTGKIMRGRILRWAQVAPQLALDEIEQRRPAINTGVIGFARGTDVMAEWRELTLKNISFICDEIAMQLIYRHHPHRVLDHRYNYSPMYGKATDPVILHFHGRKHLKSKSVPYWVPHYAQCIAENFADIQRWEPAGDDVLAAYLKTLESKL